MINDVVVICGAIVNIVPYTISFMLGRFIAGWTIGVAAAVCPIYNAEYSPP